MFFFIPSFLRLFSWFDFFFFVLRFTLSHLRCVDLWLLCNSTIETSPLNFTAKLTNVGVEQCLKCHKTPSFFVRIRPSAYVTFENSQQTDLGNAFVSAFDLEVWKYLLSFCITFILLP